MQKLKEYLKKYGITQAGFAKRLGIHPYTLNAYFSKKRNPPLYIKKLISYETKGEILESDLNEQKN